MGGTRFSMPVSHGIDKKARYFKYILLVGFIMAVSLKGDASLFKQEPLAVFFLNPLAVSTDKLLSVVVVIVSIFFLRFWCRYFCVCGAFLSLLNKRFILRKLFVKKYRQCPLHVEHADDVDCIQCNLCMGEDKV